MLAARAAHREFKVKTAAPTRQTPVRQQCQRRGQRRLVSAVLIGQPRFGLDFAAVAEIHDRILAARNGGAAVLLVSEDLDELLALSDRILVIFDGRIVHETAATAADIDVIGPAMAGHDARARTG
jgi:simple sugar transport system ATP-binding protein